MNGAVEAIEASLEWPVVFGSAGVGVPSQMPLSDGVAAVAGWLEQFCESSSGGVQIAAIGGEFAVFHHVADTSLVGIEAREQTGSGGAAAGGVVERLKPHTGGGEPIEGGSGDFATITADVGKTHIVTEDHDNVRSWRCRDDGGGDAGGHDKEGMKERLDHVTPWMGIRGSGGVGMARVSACALGMSNRAVCQNGSHVLPEVPVKRT